MEIINRKARFNYIVEDSIVCGIVLKGGEVKSIRNGKVNISDAFAMVEAGEVMLINSTVQEWYCKQNSFTGYDVDRKRKLLLNKKEIHRLNKIIQNPGYTLVPLKIFFNEKGLCKVLLGICKGKHDYDKRETIKLRDIERENKMKF